MVLAELFGDLYAADARRHRRRATCARTRSATTISDEMLTPEALAEIPEGRWRLGRAASRRCRAGAAISRA
jgi:hypothetical protein